MVGTESDVLRLRRELSRTQEQLRNLIERNGDAILVVDEAGLVRFANPAAEQLFQRPGSQIVGSELGLPVLIGETTELDIVGQPGDRVAEMRVVETEWEGAPARLAVLRDITVRKRLEKERAHLLQEQLARAQAEAAVKERDEFMALASHELKTPIATLSATAQLLQRQLSRQGALEPDQLNRALVRLNEQSHRMARLVDHLLDVSSINSGKLILHLEKIDLRKLAEQVVASCQLTTSRHAITLRCPELLEAVVDPIRIEQVLVNLLENAIKYSPDGGPIDVELSTPRPNEIQIAVRDHGLGIPMDRRDRLFERFYRVHTDGQIAGLGLGLFITQHIVELHHGHISVDAPTDGGSLFVVTLPAHHLH